MRERAQTKREEPLQDYEAKLEAKREAQEPIGLDPQEVYDDLPEAGLHRSFARHIALANSCILN